MRNLKVRNHDIQDAQHLSLYEKKRQTYRAHLKERFKQHVVHLELNTMEKYMLSMGGFPTG